MSALPTPDLAAAADVIELASGVVGKAVRVWLNWKLPSAPLWDRIGKSIH
jgi:hypothetical protein